MPVSNFFIFRDFPLYGNLFLILNIAYETQEIHVIQRNKKESDI